MKIRITSLPEYKTRGYYQNDISLPALPIYQSLGTYDPNMQPFFNLPGASSYRPNDYSSMTMTNQTAKAETPNFLNLVNFPGASSYRPANYDGSAYETNSGKNSMTTTTTTMYPGRLLSNVGKASLLSAGINRLGQSMINTEKRNMFERDAVSAGMTDNMAGAGYDPGASRRGVEEINTGDMFTNQKVPVQFQGQRAPEYYGRAYYGQAQAGALIPGPLMDNPEAGDYESINVAPTRTTAPSGSIPNIKPLKAPSLSQDEMAVLKGVQETTGVPANILAGVYGAESGFGKNPGTSSAGAQGYFQFMPKTAKQYGVDVNDFQSSALGAGKYLKDLYEQLGSWALAIAGYNAGAGNVKKYKGIPPFQETQKYVPKVLGYAKSFEDKFEDGGEINKSNTMKRKVVITNTPEFKAGGVTPGMSIGAQLNYGLYRGGLLKTNLEGTEEAADNVRTVYPEATEDNGVKPNIEVEGRGKGKKGEKIVMPDMASIYDIKGKTHEQGGVPIMAEGGSYIVSDHITGSEEMQKALGFEPHKSKAKKNNTWAKILDRKIPTKDYNRLSQILQDAQQGKDVDPYELATAKARFPGYQQYVGRAILGGELSKAMQGKEYNIPDMAKPALDSLQGISRNEGLDEQPLVEAKFGGYMPQFQSDGFVKPKTYHVGDNKDVTANYVQSIPQGYSQYNAATFPDLYYQSTPGQTVAGKAPGRGSVNFNRAFANATKAGLKEFTFNGKKFNTQRYNPTSTTTPAKEDYVYTETQSNKPNDLNWYGSYTGGNIGKDYNTSKKEDTVSETTTGGFNPRKKWWTGNVLQTAAAFADTPTQEYEWEPTVALTRPEATFRSPRQAIAAMQSNAAATKRAQALTGEGQRFASVAQGIDAQTIPGILQAEGSVNDWNAQLANQNSAQLSDIANKEAVMRGESALRLKDKATTRKFNFLQEKNMKQANFLNNYLAGDKEATKTYWRNLANKYFNVDPTDGGVGFTGNGKDLYQGVASTGMASGRDFSAQYKAALQEAKASGAPLDKQHEVAMYIMKINNPRTAQRFQGYAGYPSTTSQTGYQPYSMSDDFPVIQKNGGYIPSYRTMW